MVWSSAVSSTTTPNSNPGMDAPPAAPSARRRREHWLGQVRPPPGTQLCTQRSARRAGGGRRRFSAGELGCTGQPQQTRSKKILLLFRIPWPCHPLSLSSALAAAIGVTAPLRGDRRGSSSASGISSSMSKSGTSAPSRWVVLSVVVVAGVGGGRAPGPLWEAGTGHGWYGTVGVISCCAPVGGCCTGCSCAS